MSQAYIEYNFKVVPRQPATDILIATLGELGFESFVETETGVLAYVVKTVWDNMDHASIETLKYPDFTISSTFKEIKEQNWNAVWESNFEPILVDNRCVVRAPFHDTYDTEFDIVIEPKMSFGTGHHETTFMMLRYILKEEVIGRSVLDMGSGTGVLAILTALKRARTIDAIDIDHWCYLNARENAKRNKCEHINIREGDATLLNNSTFDLIFANINRNILLKDIPIYASSLTPGGHLFLSGFYEEDLDQIIARCKQEGLTYINHLEQKKWIAAKFKIS